MRSLLVACVPALALLLAPAPASAQTTPDECSADLASLTTLTETVVFTGDKGLFFQAKLLFHLSKATDQLAAGDVKDALHQMKDYLSDLAGAADNKVIAPVDAAALEAGAEVVIACLQAIPKK
jgi:FIMAH domain-containing protein